MSLEILMMAFRCQFELKCISVTMIDCAYMQIGTALSDHVLKALLLPLDYNKNR